MGRVRAEWRGRGFAAVLAATLAACTAPQTGEFVEPPQPRATIAPVAAVLTLALPGRNGTFAADDRERAAVFLDAYRDGGRGPLAVTVSAPDRAMAEAAVAALYYLARRRGVVEAALAVTLTDTGPAPMGIALRYTDFVAVPPACNPEVVLSRNPNGEVSPNLGCALEGSVTAMLAHPADYLSPAASTPGDGSRFGRIVDDYRQGKATQAEVNRNDDLKASTIAVNK